MAYNLRQLAYSNGTTQIRLYDEPIRPHKRKSKPLTDKPKSIPIVKSIEPAIPMTFEEIMERIAENERLKAEYSLRSSVSRTRNKIEQLSRSGNFQYFVTLTYSPEKIDRYDYDECIKKFTTWLQNIKRKAPNVQALFIPEFHTKNAKIDENGNSIYAVHFHGLMGQIGDLKLEFYKMRNGIEVYKLLDWGFGISDVTEIQDKMAVTKYIRKYITKQSISIARTHKGRHRYFKTGLIKPKETTMLFESIHKDNLIEQYIENYADTNNLTVSGEYKCSDHAYIPVKYIELKSRN